MNNREQTKQVAPQPDPQLKVEPVAPRLNTERIIAFISDAKDNSIELLNLLESGHQTKKTLAISEIYKAEIKEAEYLIGILK